MNESFWDRFQGAMGVRCIEMKDRAQERIVRETRGMSSEQLFAYFRDASRRFRVEWETRYREHTAAPMAVRETNTDKTEERPPKTD